MPRTKKSHQLITPLTKSPRNSASVLSADNIRTIYSPKLRVLTHCTGGRTKQSFKEECDINNIMARFQRTGVLDFTTRHQGTYMDVTGLDYQRAMDLVVQGQELFDALPSSLRSRFHNEPAEFLDFVQDPKNAAELVELGLAKARPEDAPPAGPGGAAGGGVPGEPPAPAEK